MCSWCWGFHPVIQQLRRDYNHLYDFSLVVGGLRTKGAMVWNTETKEALRQTWRKVADTTGQHFTDNLFTLDNFEYDTYPACKAVVTVRELWGEDAAFDYLAKVHEAFYVEGIDITLPDTLLQFIDNDKQSLFKNFYISERAEVLMLHNFSKSRSMGANMFPSVVKIDTQGHMVCKKGYQRLDALRLVL